MESDVKVPFHRPSIGEEEIREVEATLRSGWLTTGPRTHQFERDVAEYVGAPRAVAVNSATAGLHVALAALGIGPGDEVITTPLTFCATVNTILQVGARVVLADIGPDWNIDPAAITRCIHERTRAIVPVHYAGLPCDMHAIWQLAQRHRLFVIEDAAHAIGARYYGRPIGAMHGTHSDAVVFSFYATKNMTTAEGGMITTADTRLADKMEMLTLHGIDHAAWNRYGAAGSWYYEVQACGFKYNLTDLQSAIGIHQLRKLESMHAVRTEYAHRYQKAFSQIAELETPPDDPRSRHAWHLYPLRLNLETLTISRSQFIEALRDAGICASVHFIPIPLHPYYAAHTDLRGDSCPEALKLYPRLISLPLYPAMTPEQVQYVIDSVIKIVHASKRVTAVAVPGENERVHALVAAD